MDFIIAVLIAIFNFILFLTAVVFYLEEKDFWKKIKLLKKMTIMPRKTVGSDYRKKLEKCGLMRG